MCNLRHDDDDEHTVRGRAQLRSVSRDSLAPSYKKKTLRPTYLLVMSTGVVLLQAATEPISVESGRQRRRRRRVAYWYSRPLRGNASHLQC